MDHYDEYQDIDIFPDTIPELTRSSGYSNSISMLQNEEDINNQNILQNEEYFYHQHQEDTRTLIFYDSVNDENKSAVEFAYEHRIKEKKILLLLKVFEIFFNIYDIEVIICLSTLFRFDYYKFLNYANIKNVVNIEIQSCIYNFIKSCFFIDLQ